MSSSSTKGSKSQSTSNGTGGLQFVQPKPDPNLNVLLYGRPKTGKTMAGASLPGPVLYLNADRPNATRYAHATYPGELKEVAFDGLPTMVAAIAAIDDGQFKSVVLDPMGEAYTALLESLTDRALRASLPSRGDTSTHLERFCKALCEKPVNTCFIAHEYPVKDESTGTVEKLPYTGTNNPAFGGKLMAMVDVIGYTGIKEEEGEGPKYMATLVDAEGRRGGDRTGALGIARETNLSEWVDLARAASAALAQEGTAA